MWLLDVLTGRIAHWNSTNNVVISEIWSRIELLPDPQKEIFTSFSVFAASIVEAFIGPGNKAKEVGFHCNLKEISLDQFRDLYDVLLTYFVVLHYRSDSEAQRMLKLMELDVGHPPGHRLIEPLNKVVSNKDLSAELTILLGLTGEVDMVQLASQTWEQVVSILGCGDQTAGQLTYFGLMAGRLYLEASKKGSFVNTQL